MKSLIALLLGISTQAGAAADLASFNGKNLAGESETCPSGTFTHLVEGETTFIIMGANLGFEFKGKSSVMNDKGPHGCQIEEVIQASATSVAKVMTTKSCKQKAQNNSEEVQLEVVDAATIKYTQLKQNASGKTTLTRTCLLKVQKD